MSELEANLHYLKAAIEAARVATAQAVASSGLRLALLEARVAKAEATLARLVAQNLQK